MSNKPAEAAEGQHSEAVAGRLRAVVLMVLVVACFALFWPTTQSLIVRWEDTVHRTYTHGYLIVVLSLWMLWRGRERWAVASRPNLVLGVPLMLLLTVAWLLAVRAGLQIVHQALLPLIVFAAAFTCFGLRLVRRAWLPLAYLYFAIPVWDAINSGLQWISVLAVRFLLRLIGIPAYFENNTFHIPAGVFEIAGGCSGLHFFVVALAIAVLYGEIHRDSTKVRCWLVAFAALLAMATNWIRIVIIVVAGHLTQMQHYLVSGEHYTFGWFMFAGAMLLFFLVVRRWPAAPEPDVAPATGSAVAGIDRAGLIVTAVSLLVVPLWLTLDNNRASDSDLPSLPEETPGWHRAGGSVTGWDPQFEGADRRQMARFERAGAGVDVFVAAYASQAQGKELVGYGNSLAGSTMRQVGRPAAADGWAYIEAADYAEQRWLIGYVYRLDGESMTRPIALQLNYALRSLAGAPVAAVVAVRARCSSAGCDDARAVLRDFTEVAAFDHST